MFFFNFVDVFIIIISIGIFSVIYYTIYFCSRCILLIRDKFLQFDILCCMFKSFCFVFAGLGGVGRNNKLKGFEVVG
jgi:hypothetical protein